MGKDELSSDLDLVKELEQIKLKQRLLIETLRRKADLQETKVQQQMNAKLDFLVKIFKDTSGQDQEKDLFAQLEKSLTKELKDQFAAQQATLTQLSEKIAALDVKLTKLSIPAPVVAPPAPKPAFVVPQTQTVK
jgi:hypothetical protein